jgi:hypothetical protein
VRELPAVIRYLDLVVLAVALPVFVIAGLPIAGYAVAAGAWIAQRAIQVAVQRRTAASEDPRTVVGFTVGGMIVRGWLVALSIFLVGLSDNDAGLAAAVLLIALFSCYFAIQMATRPFGPPGGAQ